jgi:hypothetical protein
MTDKMFYPCDPKLSMITDTYIDHVNRDGYMGYNGYDVASYGGAAILLYSPISGKVIYSGWSDNGLGNHIMMQNDNYQCLLGHMSACGYAVGAEVVAGKQVGIMGSTGNSTGVHVHWSMWRRNNRLLENPWKIIDVGAELMTFYNPVHPDQRVTAMSDGNVVVEDNGTDYSLAVGDDVIVDSDIGLYLRSTPDTDNKPLGLLYDGLGMAVIEDAGEWVKVKVEGYCHKGYLCHRQA